jgi:penicillin-binding protein 1A
VIGLNRSAGNQCIGALGECVSHEEFEFPRLIPASSQAEEVVSPQTAYLMTYLMQGVVERGTASSAAGLLNDIPLAGKTGTTDRYTDAWFIGFSPSLCVGFWIGYDEPKNILGPNETGAVAALPAWIDFFKAVIEAKKKAAADARTEVQREEFEIPSNIVFKPIDLKTGLLAQKICKWRFMEAFLDGTEPVRFCSYEDHMMTLNYSAAAEASEERIIRH